MFFPPRPDVPQGVELADQGEVLRAKTKGGIIEHIAGQLLKGVLDVLHEPAFRLLIPDALGAEDLVCRFCMKAFTRRFAQHLHCPFLIREAGDAGAGEGVLVHRQLMRIAFLGGFEGQGRLRRLQRCSVIADFRTAQTQNPPFGGFCVYCRTSLGEINPAIGLTPNQVVSGLILWLNDAFVNFGS